MNAELARARVLDAVRDCQEAVDGTKEPFDAGVSEVWPSGAVLDAEDRVALVEAALDPRIAAGPVSRHVESAFARRMERRKARLTNSGSSANLLAVSALTSPPLGERRLRPGDEVATVAAGFPTTVNPILQNGLVPVFVDIDLGTYNTTADRVARAIGPRTRAVVIAHALGNPFEAAEIADAHGLHLVADNCDANDRCRKRFGQRAGTLPPGYDHKDIFSHVGYNLKATDLQAALGLSQLTKLDAFVAACSRNWARLRQSLDGAPRLVLPRATERAEPGWFGFAVTVEPEAPFTARELTAHLESSGIVTSGTFWVGVYPGLSDEKLDHIASTVKEFLAARG